MSRSVNRVQLASAYVLHQRPFRDSSLIVEIFAREYGRMTVFAHAARGPRPRFGALQPFQALLLSWIGRGEAPQLIGAEAEAPGEPGGPPPWRGDPALALSSAQPPAAAHLMSAFYLNELLLTLTTRHDPHPELFDQYGLTLAQLRCSQPAEAALRRFEARLLDLIGYGLNLAAEADTGRPVRAEAHYHYRPGVHGVVLAADASEEAIPGRVLQGLVAAAELSGETELRQARALMRRAIDHCLEGRPLRTRVVARSLSNYPRKERRA